MNEFEAQIDKAEAEKVKAQIAELRESVARIQGGEDVNPTDLKTKTDALQEASLKLFEKVYKDKAANNSENDEKKE